MVVVLVSHPTGDQTDFVCLVVLLLLSTMCRNGFPSKHSAVCFACRDGAVPPQASPKWDDRGQLLSRFG